MVAMVVHLLLCKRRAQPKPYSSRFYFYPFCVEVVLTVNCILHEVAESLHLSYRPSCQHRQSDGANEERNNQDNDAIGNAVEQENCKTEDAEDRTDDTEYPSGQFEHQGEYPDHDGKDCNYGCEQYLQNELHRKPLLSSDYILPYDENTDKDAEVSR